MTTGKGQPVPPATVADIAGTASLVVAATAAGPIFAGRRAPERRTGPRTFCAALSPRDRLAVAALSAVWAVLFIAFWLWWLNPDHIAGRTGLALNSMFLIYLSYLSGYFVLMANRLRRINPEVQVPALRTAFVVTKAPSEPWELARTTLSAMLSQDFPHPYDVWLCDEAPTEEVLAWCGRNEVRVSTRNGVAEYHQQQWPRRTKCKEGNLAYFYDHWGYADYDVVAQLDCDHVPASSYLAEVVRAFADPAIGYVAAPSINDSNARDSWAARGRLHCEATLHGPVQLGHSDGLAPLCIGSHYAVRTQALRMIGGIGPELAEDFSTTLLLTSAGWKSAFVHTAAAHGEGPRNFSSMATQEFQWSRSLMTLFMDTAPGHIRRLRWRLRIRFLFALGYYPLLAMATLLGLAMPIIAAVTGDPWVKVNYGEFLARWTAVDLATLALMLLLRRRNLLRPVDAPVISWEGCLYALVRWPFVVGGILAAVLQKFRPAPVQFRVTPKTPHGAEVLPARLVLPFCAASVALALGALIGEATTRAYGYVFMCSIGSVCYAVVAVSIAALHALESARTTGGGFTMAARKSAAVPLAAGAGASMLALASVIIYPSYLLSTLGY